MKVKGWTIIFQPLSPKVLDDGVSVICWHAVVFWFR